MLNKSFLLHKTNDDTSCNGGTHAMVVLMHTSKTSLPVAINAGSNQTQLASNASNISPPKMRNANETLSLKLANSINGKSKQYHDYRQSPASRALRIPSPGPEI